MAHSPCGAAKRDFAVGKQFVSAAAAAGLKVRFIAVSSRWPTKAFTPGAGGAGSTPVRDLSYQDSSIKWTKDAKI